MSANLFFKTVTGATTLRVGTPVDGKATIEIWYDDQVIAWFFTEFFFDFVAEAYDELGPDENQYIDRGRRYRQVIYSFTLPELQ